jgi:hypothetical protein
MSAVVFERAGVTDISRAMARAQQWLVSQGCAPAASSMQELQFVLTRGGPLRLVVQFSSAKVRFVFTGAAPGVKVPAESELLRLVEGAVEGQGEVKVVEATTSVPRATAVETRCSICATRIPVGATECPLCGMPVK